MPSPLPLSPAEVSLRTLDVNQFMHRLVNAVPTLKDAVIAITEPRGDARVAEIGEGTKSYNVNMGQTMWEFS